MPVATRDQTGVNVGDTVKLQGSFTDPDNTGGDSFAWTVLNSTGQQVAAGTTQAFSFVPTTPNLYFATFTVTDALGGVGQATARMTAGQVAPTIAISGATTTAEGSIYQLNLATAGISPDAITGWTINWGDGTSIRSRVTPARCCIPMRTARHRDDHRQCPGRLDRVSGCGRVTVAIGNVAPTATFTSSGPVFEGSTATVSFADAYDPSPADTAAGFHYSFATTQAALATSYVAAGTVVTWSFAFADNGNHTVYGRVFDKDGGSTDYTTTIVVTNTSPTADFSIDSPRAAAFVKQDATTQGTWINTYGRPGLRRHRQARRPAQLRHGHPVGRRDLHLGGQHHRRPRLAGPGRRQPDRRRLVCGLELSGGRQPHRLAGAHAGAVLPRLGQQ